MQNSLSNWVKKLFLPLLLTTAMIIWNGEISKVFGQKNMDEYGNQYGYKTERKNGKEILYFHNGNIHRKVNINENWRREWTLVTYYPNRRQEAEVNYKDGTLEGMNTEWYENGNKKKEGNWHNDEKNGIRKKYYENGKTHWLWQYRNGEEIGTRFFIDEEWHISRIDF